MRERVSVVFFAEGTRSDDGVLRPFKKGAAVIAIEAQVPLVPAAVAGTHEILPKGTLAHSPAAGGAGGGPADRHRRAHARRARRLTERRTARWRRASSGPKPFSRREKVVRRTG